VLFFAFYPLRLATFDPQRHAAAADDSHANSTTAS
jgi:hypothetical protein